MRCDSLDTIQGTPLICLIQALKECRRTKDLARGRKLHKEATKTGEKLNTFVASSLVSMYASCNSLAEARSIFDGMSFRDVVSWNSLLFGYVENGEGEQAFQLFLAMRSFPSPRPNVLTFIGAIKACTILAKNEPGKQVGVVKVHALRQGENLHSQAMHELQMNNSLELKRKYVFLASSLIDMYSKCGSMTDAQKVFESVPHEQVDEVLLTALSLGYAENGDGRSSLALFARITSNARAQPAGTRAYVAALKACSTLAEEENGRKMNNLEIGMTIHRIDLSTTRYSVRDTLVGNAAIDMYSKCGSVSDAERVFYAMQQHDVVSWNTLIMGYVLNGQSQLALQLYVLMQSLGEQFPANALTILAVAKACCSLAEFEEGNVDGLKMVSLEIGMSLHSQAMKAECQLNSFVASSMIDMYSKCGSVLDARRVFDRIQAPNTVTWNVLLSAYVNNGQAEEALGLFQSMTCTGCVPDPKSYVAALKACTALAEKEDGRTLHDGKIPVKALSLERGMAIHRAVCAAACCDCYVESSLVDVYSKSGAVHEAYRVFQGMQTRDTVAWTSLLLGHVSNDQSREALRLFLEECDDKTNIWILVAALKACGNAAAVETGKSLIHGQLCRYGFENVPAVVTSLVDFYGKIGSLSIALTVFHSATLCEKKDVLTWAALINGYSRVGDFHGALRIFCGMVDEGLLPNAVMFMEILTVCSHAGFVNQGKVLFDAMQSFGVRQGFEHYQCMVDLLTRGNHLDAAVTLLEQMPFKATVLNWMTVLGACYKWRNIKVAKRAFDEVMLLDKNQETAYVLMSNICRAD